MACLKRNWPGIVLSLLPVPVILPLLGFAHVLAVCGAAYFVLSAPGEVRRAPAVLLFPCFVAGLLAPGLAALLLVRELWMPDLPINFPISWLGLRWSIGYSVFAALCGAAVGLWAIGGQGIWKRHQRLQGLNLPTSSVQAVAAGQVKLKGVARRLDGGPDGDILSFTTGMSAAGFHQHAEPFYLEDATGRILVDPRGATVRGGVTSNLEERLFEVLLTRGALRPGDPVYLIGHAQRREDAPPETSGPESLVVKPLEEPATGLLPRLLRRGLGLSRREHQHVFFLTDTSEEEARALALDAGARSWIMGILYLATAAALLRAEGPRFVHGTARWTVHEIYVHERGAARVDGLKARLRDPDPRVRAEAMSFLDYAVRDEAGVAIDAEILQALEDPAADVRDEAFEALLKVGLRGPEPDVMLAQGRLLESGQPRLRRYALERLAALKRPLPEAGPALLRRIDDPDEDVRKAAVEALAAYPAAAQQALPSLLGRLNDSFERWSVARTLRWLDYDPAFAVREFLKRREDPSPRVRTLSLQVLGRYKEANAAVVPAIRRSLADPDPRVRYEAADALALNAPAGLYDDDRLPVLTALLAENDLELLQSAVSSLGNMGPRAACAVPALIRLRQEPAVVAGGFAGKLDVEAVLHALGRIGDPAGEEAILSCLADDRPKVRIAAAAAAAALRPPLREGRTARVRALDAERVHEAQQAMARALIRDGSADSLAAVGEWLAGGRGHFHVRLEAARELGGLGRAAAPALPGLQRAAERDDREIREAAAAAIRRIRGSTP